MKFYSSSLFWNIFCLFLYFSKICECYAAQEDMSAIFWGSPQAQPKHYAMGHKQTAPQPSMRDDNVEIPKEKRSSFERLKATKGAIFDCMHVRLTIPKLVFEAFGYNGCPPMIVMDPKISVYVGTWRFGRKRYKRFYTISKSYIMRTINNP